MGKKKRILGREDIIDLPEFGLNDVRAKIDTGAYTSSINCSKVRQQEIDGKSCLVFYIPGSRIHSKGKKKFMCYEFSRRKIRSSNGQTEERFIIKTPIILFGKKRMEEFSLADRSKMKFPILLGRKLLANRYIVDVSETNLSYKKKVADQS